MSSRLSDRISDKGTDSLTVTFRSHALDGDGTGGRILGIVSRSAGRADSRRFRDRLLQSGRHPRISVTFPCGSDLGRVPAIYHDRYVDIVALRAEFCGQLRALIVVVHVPKRLNGVWLRGPIGVIELLL